MSDRTFNTLFLLISVDGKISTGVVDSRDTDKDYKRIRGIKEGVHQYYEIERQTDPFSLNTGKVMAKIGVNSDDSPIKCPKVNFIIVDSSHLTTKGVQNLCDNLAHLYIVTTSPDHPAFDLQAENLTVLRYEDRVDFPDLFQKLRKEYGAERVTIQSGGTLNAVLIREKLIDQLSVVVAPALVGGKDTASLVDGEGLINESDLRLIKALKLKEANVLEDSYLHLVYDVINETEVD